jgi:hypothetical protein
MAVAIPIALEVGQLLAASLGTAGVKKIATLILTGGAEGAKRTAKEYVEKQLGKLSKELSSAEGRDRLIAKAGDLGNTAEKAATKAAVALNSVGALNAMQARKVAEIGQKANKHFHNVLSAMSKVHNLSKLAFGG